MIEVSIGTYSVIYSVPGVRGCVMYNSTAVDSMTADKGTIQKSYAWEGQLLAIIGGLRKKSSEDWTVYTQRRLRYGRHRFA
eukprot:8287743-Pyramimonas_sp.AAC.1